MRNHLTLEGTGRIGWFFLARTCFEPVILISAVMYTHSLTRLLNGILLAFERKTHNFQIVPLTARGPWPNARLTVFENDSPATSRKLGCLTHWEYISRCQGYLFLGVVHTRNLPWQHSLPPT